MMDRVQKCGKQLQRCKSDRRRCYNSQAFDQKIAVAAAQRRGIKIGVFGTIGGTAVVTAIVVGIVYAVRQRR